MELTFAAATDVGRQRTHNEDNFLIDKKLRLFLVADGMGGHAAGEVASSIAVHEIRDAVYANRDLIDRYRAEGPASAAVEVPPSPTRSTTPVMLSWPPPPLAISISCLGTSLMSPSPRIAGSFSSSR